MCIKWFKMLGRFNLIWTNIDGVNSWQISADGLILTLTSLTWGIWKTPPSINPESVRLLLWNLAWVWVCYYTIFFKKYQNSNQGHVTFLMTPSCLKTIIEVKHFYEEIKFPMYNEINLWYPSLLPMCYYKRQWKFF